MLLKGAVAFTGKALPKPVAAKQQPSSSRVAMTPSRPTSAGGVYAATAETPRVTAAKETKKRSATSAAAASPPVPPLRSRTVTVAVATTATSTSMKAPPVLVPRLNLKLAKPQEVAAGSGSLDGDDDSAAVVDQGQSLRVHGALPVSRPPAVPSYPVASSSMAGKRPAPSAPRAPEPKQQALVPQLKHGHSMTARGSRDDSSLGSKSSPSTVPAGSLTERRRRTTSDSLAVLPSQQQRPQLPPRAVYIDSPQGRDDGGAATPPSNGGVEDAVGSRPMVDKARALPTPRNLSATLSTRSVRAAPSAAVRAPAASQQQLASSTSSRSRGGTWGSGGGGSNYMRLHNE
jgi:hypothetical protein